MAKVSMINELYSGNIFPQEQIAMQMPQEYKSIEKQLLEMTAQFKKEIPRDSQRQLEKYFDLQSKLQSISVSVAFCYGYKLGAQMTAETLKK